MMPFRTDVGRLAGDLPDPLARVDAHGTVVWRNARFRDLTEGDGPTRLGRPLRELAATDDRGVVEAALTGLADGATRADASVRLRTADGTWTVGVLRFQRTPPHETHEGFATVLVRLV